MRTRFSTLKKRETVVINSRGIASNNSRTWNSFSVAATRRDYEEKPMLDEIAKKYEEALKRSQRLK